MALANWMDYWLPGGACDTLQHTAVQAMALNQRDAEQGVNDLFPRIRLHMANFDVTEYPELKRVGEFMWVRGDHSKPLDPALEFHVVIRENWNLAGTQPKIRKFLSLMHEMRPVPLVRSSSARQYHVGPP